MEAQKRICNMFLEKEDYSRTATSRLVGFKPFLSYCIKHFLVLGKNRNLKSEAGVVWPNEKGDHDRDRVLVIKLLNNALVIEELRELPKSKPANRSLLLFS